MNIEGLKIKVGKDLGWGNGVSINMGHPDQYGNMMIAQPVVFKTHPPGASIPIPMLRLQGEEAQLLMDELWNVGVRPSEGSGSAGQLAATQKHLDDMREMAFRAQGWSRP
jgi:hypothetical protein